MLPISSRVVPVNSNVKDVSEDWIQKLSQHSQLKVVCICYYGELAAWGHLLNSHTLWVRF